MRAAVHERYSESGIRWLGKVPGHWNVVPARVAVRNIDDKNDGARDQNYLSLVAGRGVMPYADKGDMGNKKPEDLGKCKLVRCGNIVLNSMNFFIGSYGMSAYDGVCSPVYIVLEVLSKMMHPRFALRVFGTSSFQTYLATFGDGILKHRAAIGWDDIKGQYLPCPPLDEQVQIARFLDYETARIDALIEKQQQLIALLKEKRQAVISHAVTKGLNPNAPLRDSGVEWLGMVPAHWEVSRAKHVAGVFVPQRNKPQLNDEGGLPWITMDDMRVEEIVDGRIFVSKEAADAAGSRVLPAGAVIASCVGTFGVCAINRLDVVINQQLQAFVPIGIEPDYLAALVASSVSYFERVSTAATITYVNQSGFDEMPVVVPPHDEQRSICHYLLSARRRFDAAIDKSSEIVALLQERRTALISAAVTGKIDVRGWTPPESTMENAVA